MSTGQTILTLGAIVLFMITSVNISRSYVMATHQTVDQQTQKDIVNYGQTLVSEVYSTPYDTLTAVYDQYDDEANSNRSKRTITKMDDTLSATINISAEQLLIHNAKGKIATISVFKKESGTWVQRSGHNIAITPIQ